MYVAWLIYGLQLFSFSYAFHYQLNVGFCTYECSNEAEVLKKQQEIKGYYWRDYKGSIPTDAYPLGDKNQSPQTYIGHVVNRDNKELATVTIFAGQPYVYVVNNDTVKKISKEIQILCTQTPKRFRFANVAGGAQRPTGAASVESGNKQTTTFVATRIKRSECGMVYASSTASLTQNGSYVTSMGVAQMAAAKDMDILYHLPMDPEEDEKKKKTSSAFIKHRYHLMISQDSIIPKFYRKLVIGVCSVTCTNMCASGGGSSGYYWRPNSPDSSDVIVAGKSFRGQDLYIGNTYNSLYDIHLVGTCAKTSPTSTYNINILSPTNFIKGTGRFNFRLLCTQQPDDFEWIPVNASSFLQMRDKLFIEGSYSNGSELAIIRAKRGDEIIPGAAPLVNQAQLLIDSYDREFEDVEALIYKGAPVQTNDPQDTVTRIIGFLRRAFGFGIKIKF